MTSDEQQQFSTTREWLINEIGRFIKLNEQHGWVDAESFGWMACGDNSLCHRLLEGGDVRTAKMDQILAFMKNPVPPPKWKRYILTPITLTRRVYD